MKKILPLTTLIFMCLLLPIGCGREETDTSEFDRLPDLPADIAATLDPNTMATKIPPSNLSPTRQFSAAAGPCCDTTDRKQLKVKFSYTKCGPRRDFIVERTPAVKAFKLRSFNGNTFLDQQVCFSSEGPWNAIFLEERRCDLGLPLQDSLFISAFGDLVAFVWTGGTANHPPEVQLVNCRNKDTTNFKCDKRSDCICQNFSCPADQPCACTLEGWSQ